MAVLEDDDGLYDLTDLIVVTATVTHDTYFASFVGYDQLDARAVAAAGCAPVCPVGVLPIAWSCRDPIGGYANDWCAIDYPPESEEHPELNINNLYIVMDSDKLVDDLKYCMDPPNSPLPAGCGGKNQPPCPVDCDLDNDGLNDLLTGGDRSWLDLDGGGGGASELSNWITGGFPGEIVLNNWFASQTGSATSIFHTVDTIVNTDVYIPVFDQICEGDPSDPANQENCHFRDNSPTEEVIYGGGTATTYYRIVGFAAFRVTCVFSGGKDECTGHQWLKQNLDKKDFPDSTKTIEGYFLPPDTIPGDPCEGDAAQTNLSTIVLRR